MDFFLGTSFDDLVVPKGDELSYRLPSPGSWSEWGVRPASNFQFCSPCKCFSDAEYPLEVTTSCVDEFQQDECIFESSAHRKNHNGILCGNGELACEYAKLTAHSSDQLYGQPDCVTGIEQLDDVFMNSLLEEYSFSSTTQCGVVPSAEMGLDLQEFSCDEHRAENEIYDKIHVPSMSERSASSSSPFGLKRKEVPHEKVKYFSDSEKTIEDEFVEETSLEEFVLQNLEMVMKQMTDETRICFRDAFYRLAKNYSKHQALMQHEQVGELAPLTASTTMAEGERAMEAKTNCIDRAVANLVFNNRESHQQSIPASSTSKPFAAWTRRDSTMNLV